MGRKKQSFLQGAAVLMAALAAVKVLGALFKIPLSWILTPVGNAYFGSAYALYFPIYSLAAAGFPTAVARMVSACCAKGRYRDVRALQKQSGRLFLLLGLGGFALMLALAWPYACLSARSQPQSLLPAIWALAPCALFCSLLSVYRGLYEGLRNMTPTAVSQVIEAAGKLVFGLGLAGATAAAAQREFLEKGTVWGVAQESAEFARLAALPACAAGAVFGVTIGSGLAFLYLAAYHGLRGDGLTPAELRASPPARPGRLLCRELLGIAVPMALGSLAVNLSTLVDAAFLNRRLADLMQQQPGLLPGVYEGLIPAEVLRTQGVPAFLYGCYTNANTLFMLLPAAAQAFAVSALPGVTAAWTAGARKELAHRVSSVLRAAALFAVPAGLGLSVLAQPLSEVLFGGRNAPAITAQILQIMGIAAIFCALSTPVQSMLQAVGRADIPVKLLFAALAGKIVLNWLLVGSPRFHVLGAALSTLACYAFLFLCALFCLLRESRLRLKWFHLLGKPLLAGLLCAQAARMLWQALQGLLPDSLALAGAVLGGIAVYAAAAVVLGCVRWGELRRLRHRP